MAGKTAEERIAAIDEKIAKKQAEIDVLEAQKQKLLHPVTMRSVMSKLSASRQYENSDGSSERSRAYPRRNRRKIGVRGLRSSE